MSKDKCIVWPVDRPDEIISEAKMQAQGLHSKFTKNISDLIPIWPLSRLDSLVAVLYLIQREPNAGMHK